MRLVAMPLLGRCRGDVAAGVVCVAIGFLGAGCASPQGAKFDEARSMEKAGRPDEAVRSYYSALELSPGLVEARQNLGAIYYDQKQYDKAEREFRLVLSQDPERTAARENLAITLETKGGAEEEALQHWQTALAREERAEWKEHGRSSISRLERKIKVEALAPPSDVDRIPQFAAKPRPNDVALVIGIERYQKLSPARHAKNDAETVARYLRALGYSARNVEVLFNDQATLSGLRLAVESWLPAHVKSDSRVLVYYAGHGSPDPVTGEAYIVPHDGDPSFLKETAYPLKGLYAKLAELKTGQTVVAIDSCFSGSGGRSVMMEGRPAVARIEDPVLASPRLAVLAAAQGTQISTTASEKRHGLFTYYFIKALQDGKTQLGDIYDYLGPRVADDAQLQRVQQSPNLTPANAPVRSFALWDKE